MNEIRDRVARVLEACHTKIGFDPPWTIASWEQDALLTWRDRDPLVLSYPELELLGVIENLLLGLVR